MDRLGDMFLTDSEIQSFDLTELEQDKYSKCEPTQKMICAYPMYTAKGNTKVVVIIATDDPTGTLEAINRDWKDTSLSAMDPYTNGELEWGIDVKLDALYKVLISYKFSTELKASTGDRLYKWEDWMINIL